MTSAIIPTSVGLLFQPVVDTARALAEQCARALDPLGITSVILSTWDLQSDHIPSDLGLVVTFGGDGTILRTARWLAGTGVPIVGVQMGRLGFLAELQPGDLPDGLSPYLNGDYWLDRRTMLEAEVDPTSSSANGDPSQTHLTALNDVVVGRGQSLRTVTVELSMDHQLLHSFRADGLIIATATGSTAYSFAAGGPILAPQCDQLVATPICPHISGLRSLVLEADSVLQMRVRSTQPAVLTVDGQIDHELADGQIVTVRRSTRETLFARRGSPGQFYGRILAKLD